MFKTKCVYTEIEPRKDGLRILATRGRGRGLPTDRFDVWMANLGPSERLREEFLGGQNHLAGIQPPLSPRIVGRRDD